MRQSLAQLEQAFLEETHQDRRRRESLRHAATKRSRLREVERRHKQGSVRFALLVLALLTTAVLVTVAMFQTLYWVMG
jgi:hypothetical protein